ncbi:outer membrane protein assembly factor BamA [Sphingomonas sp. ASV193]|uniref:outer membrane protein assembly factor BamA n=1 Tax=Sphingomonas sp. ASV193 TaxID=3144405 RepID=UPI0032E85596
MLGGAAMPAYAQSAFAPGGAQAPAAAPAPTSGVIHSIAVRGSQRLEPETIRAYANLGVGQTYTAESLDQALKALYATELFSDVVITGADTGNLVITVKESPVINRIVLEGNKKLKDDKIMPEIHLAPREIFTRSKVRSDVERIIELYKREGRYAATVDPKIVQLDQNRVDLVFEIHEGDKSKIRAINIIGNDKFSDSTLRKQMYTKQAGGPLGFLKSNDSYDPDRLAADQQKLRAFYLTQGYADFRVVSALAELTPDRKDFVITYVVEEGKRYKFGDVTAESDLRDFTDAQVMKIADIHKGEWFNAKRVEDTVDALNSAAGNKGYAFAQVDPSYNRDADTHTMGVVFKLRDTPRVYVERIDITGNTQTRDKVIRREFRVNEGDAFNAIKIKRSQDRLQGLGFFQDKLEIKQTQGSAPDRVVLGVNVEEKSTGQLSLSAGYSSLEKVVFSGQISQSNFMGKGQVASASVDWSAYSKSVALAFTEPHFLDRNIALGGQIYRRDYSSYNYLNNQRNTTYKQVSLGGALKSGFPLTEYSLLGLSYSLVKDNITLDKATFYTNGVCDPLKAGAYLCDELGGRLTSAVGVSYSFDNTDSIHPTRGRALGVTQDFAGLGGDVRYLRTRISGTQFVPLPKSFVLSIHAEGGAIKALQKGPIDPFDATRRLDPIRLTDRFFGGDQLRGFDIRGIGPRVIRQTYDSTGALLPYDPKTDGGDALGGHYYYQGRLEVEFPTSSGLKSLGLRPSAYVDIGSIWGVRQPDLINYIGVCSPNTTTNPTGTAFTVKPGGSTNCADYAATHPGAYTYTAGGIKESFVGNSPSPRLSVGIGVNWVSPFGPLRLDLAKALIKQPGDQTKLFTFNVGTSF